MEKQFSVMAVICEYNPFHFGHKHQIDIMKENSKLCVGIMSGATVQRGSLAVADKYNRAAAAVKAGLDLVVELPFPYSSASAEDFAAAGVHIAAAIGADSLCFGVEENPAVFKKMAATADADLIKKRALTYIKAEKSLSYPRAVSLAAEEILGKEGGEALTKPNNILGFEYVSAIKKGGYGITPFPIQRNAAFPSSSSIRSAESFEGKIPYADYFAEPRRDLKYMERWILMMLRHHEWGELYCVDAPFTAVIKKAAREATSLEEFYALATGKVYTAARVRRAVLAIWFNVLTEEVKARPDYTLLLAANDKGTAYLKKIKKTEGITIITKPASYKKTPFKEAFEKGLYVNDLAAGAVAKLPKYSSSLCKTPNIQGVKEG